MAMTTSTDGVQQSPSSSSNPQSDQEQQKPPYDYLFSLELPEGRCVGLRLGDWPDSHANALTPQAIGSGDHWIHRVLHPQEVAYGIAQPVNHARETFYLGRLAMREALKLEQVAGLDECVILRDDHRRPKVPKGYLGSISHKKTTGVALVAKIHDGDDSCGPQMGVGIDIEQTSTERRSIAKRILTERELGELGRIEVRENTLRV